MSSGTTGYGIDVTSGGTLTVLSGAITSGTTIDSDGFSDTYTVESVEFGGTAVGTTVNGSFGKQDVGGTAIGTVVNGIQVVYLSGTATGTTVYKGGVQQVQYGGTATNTAVEDGGKQIATVSGTLTSTTVDSGGLQYLIAGGTALRTTVNGGGLQYLIGGGTALHTTVNGGGLQSVGSGGTVTGSTINRGGTEIVSSGGATSGTTVLSGGTLELMGGAAETDTVVWAGGTLEAGPGYTETGFTVSSGATLVVLSGGAASGITVSAGGTIRVDAGGTAFDPTVAGGSLVLATGSTLRGDIHFAGGAAPNRVEIDGPFPAGSASYGHSLSGIQIGDQIDLAGLSDAGGQVSATVTSQGSDQLLTVTSGGAAETFGLRLFGASRFTAADDGHGGTLLTVQSAAAPVPVSPTITGTHGSTTTMEAAVAPFAGVTIGDDNVGAIDAITITLSGGGGTLSGNSLTHNDDGSYTLASGTFSDVQAALQALTFTPAKGSPGDYNQTGFTLTDNSSASGTPAVDNDTTVNDTAAPTITGTHGSTTTMEAAVAPFAGVTIGDAGWDEIRITLLGGGGTLSGSEDLTKTDDNIYMLAIRSRLGKSINFQHMDVASLQRDLQALTFTPKAGMPGIPTSTTFIIQDYSDTGTMTADRSTVVTDLALSATPAAPVILGTGATSTTGEAPVMPFGGIIIGDRNANAINTLTITVAQGKEGTGALADGEGYAGLTRAKVGAAGVYDPYSTYTLKGTAAQVQAELRALTFTPAAGDPGVATPTVITLSDKSSDYATAATDRHTVVTDTPYSAIPVAPTITGTRASYSQSVFAGVTLIDSNAGATDTLIITFGGGGTKEPVAGTLADGMGFSGLSTNPNGSYTLIGTASAVQAELRALRFMPSSMTSTVGFTLTDKSSAFGTATVDSKTVYSPPTNQVAPVDPIGRAVDGYLAGATVFADANGNGQLDPGEAFTTTDGTGNFTLDGGSAPLVLTGGTDISTGLANTAQLTAPAGSTVVTPLTTLVQALVAGGSDASSAQQQVASALGLDPSTPLTTLDPVAGTEAGDPLAAAAYVTGVEVADTLALLSAGGAPTPVATLANALASGPVDLTDDATVTALATAAGVTSDPAAVGALAGASNAAAAQAAAGLQPAAVVNGVAAVQKVAQGTTAPAVASAGTDASALADVQASYTGANLAAAIAAATLAAASPRGGSDPSAPAPATPDPVPASPAPVAVQPTPVPASPAPVIVPPTPVQPAMSGIVSLSHEISYDHGIFTLTGTASSAAGVSSVEITADVDGVAMDLGAATVNANGTFTFADRIGRHTQSFITATETDNAGGTASGGAPYSLTGGRPGGGAERDTYSADGSAVLQSIRFAASGQRFVGIEAPGQTVDLQPFDIVSNHRQGSTAFVFSRGDGLDVIGGFKVGGTDHDTIALPSADFRSFADVLRNTGSVGGSAVITDPKTGDAIRLAGVTTAELKMHSKDFTFV